MNIKHRHFIQKSQIRELQDDVLLQYDETIVSQIFPKKARIELIETDEGDTLYAVNNVLKLWKSKEGYIPVLTLLLNKQVNLKLYWELHLLSTLEPPNLRFPNRETLPGL